MLAAFGVYSWFLASSSENQRRLMVQLAASGWLQTPRLASKWSPAGQLYGSGKRRSRIGMHLAWLVLTADSTQAHSEVWTAISWKRLGNTTINNIASCVRDAWASNDVVWLPLVTDLGARNSEQCKNNEQLEHLYQFEFRSDCDKSAQTGEAFILKPADHNLQCSLKVSKNIVW